MHYRTVEHAPTQVLTIVLPELSWRWMVLLGLWSVDQRQGLLGPIVTVEPQDHGPGTPIEGHRASVHGPLVLAL